METLEGLAYTRITKKGRRNVIQEDFKPKIQDQV